MTYFATQEAEARNEVSRFESMGTALTLTAKAVMPSTNGVRMNFMVCFCCGGLGLERELKRAELKNKKRREI